MYLNLIQFCAKTQVQSCHGSKLMINIIMSSDPAFVKLDMATGLKSSTVFSSTSSLAFPQLS